MAAAKPSSSEMAGIPNIHSLTTCIMDAVRFIVVGVGGNGLYIHDHLARTIGGLEKNFQERASLIAVDFDTFEPKNLGRQRCIPADIGRNKAEVATMRAQRAYNLPDECLSFWPEKITCGNDVIDFMLPRAHNIFIDCLDKTTPRKHIHDAIIRYSKGIEVVSMYVISAGNGEWGGQVIMGGVTKKGEGICLGQKGRKATDPAYNFSIPLPYDLYPALTDIKADEKEEALSCADRLVENIQTLAVNVTASTLAYNYANCILADFVGNTQREMGLTTAGVEFDAFDNQFRHTSLTDEYLYRVDMKAIYGE